MEIQEGSNILYRSTLPEGHAKHGFGKWRPSIFMRRWMSRLTLEITAVRVERLQDITETDAMAEGIEELPGRHPQSRSWFWKIYDEKDAVTEHPRHSYQTLWDSINDKNPPRGEIRQSINPHSWAENPWVWVLNFQKVYPLFSVIR